MPDNHIEIFNPVLKRMAEYLSFKDIAPTKADRLMRSGNGRLGKMIANNTEPKPSFIEIFLRTFPEVNRNWLERNEGEMLLKHGEQPKNHNNTEPKTYEPKPITEMQSQKIIALQDEIIETLKEKVKALENELSEFRGDRKSKGKSLAS